MSIFQAEIVSSGRNHELIFCFKLRRLISNRYFTAVILNRVWVGWKLGTSSEYTYFCGGSKWPPPRVRHKKRDAIHGKCATYLNGVEAQIRIRITALLPAVLGKTVLTVFI